MNNDFHIFRSSTRIQSEISNRLLVSRLLKLVRQIPEPFLSFRSLSEFGANWKIVVRRCRRLEGRIGLARRRLYVLLVWPRLPEIGTIIGLPPL